MKKILTICFTVFCLATILSSFSCDSAVAAPTGFLAGKYGNDPYITIVSWNLQTFFDAVDSGTEYEDFTGVKSSWNETKYKARLSRLCNFMESTNADVYCFMEVENDSVVHDISNTLHLQNSRCAPYPYTAFNRGNEGSIGCAVFSRIPIENITLHSTQFKATVPSTLFETWQSGITLAPPILRPLMEVTLLPFNEGSKPLKLFVNHWKSKSSGGRESELWRNTQEALLSFRMTESVQNGYDCIAVGDFNRDLHEFYWSGPKRQGGPEPAVRLRSLFNSIDVISPWMSGSFSGSYYYDGNWTTLDHVFVTGDIKITDFSVLDRGELSTASGIPNSYSIWTGEGYSDHFPLKVKLSYTNH